MLYAALTLAWLAGLIYAAIPSYWLVVHPFADKWRARKGRIYTPLGFAWLAFIILLGIVTGRWRFNTLYQTPWSLLPGGVLVALDFYLLRKIGRDFGSDRLIGRHELNPAQTDNLLITTGMHARMRHPIYLAHLIMLTGLTVASGLTVMFGLLAFAVITGAFMIRAEDAELEKRFGEEYREYRKRVPAIGWGLGFFILSIGIFQAVLYSISSGNGFYFDPRIGTYFLGTFIKLQDWPSFVGWLTVIIYLPLAFNMIVFRSTKPYVFLEGLLTATNIFFFVWVWAVNIRPVHGFSRVELIAPVIVTFLFSWLPLGLAILELRRTRIRPQPV